MRNRAIRGSIALALLVQGCGQAPEAPTVSWYQAHPKERQTKVTWCADDMQRMKTPDCQNALAADQRQAMGRMEDAPPLDWNKPDKKP